MSIINARLISHFSVGEQDVSYSNLKLPTIFSNSLVSGEYVG